jgi:hypothetical protein
MQLGEHACCGTAYTRRLSAARCHSRGEHHRQPHIMQVVRAGCHTFGSVPSQSKMRKAESRPRACSRAVCLQPPLYFCILCFIGKHGGGGFDGLSRDPLSSPRSAGKRQKAKGNGRARRKTKDAAAHHLHLLPSRVSCFVDRRSPPINYSLVGAANLRTEERICFDSHEDDHALCSFALFWCDLLLLNMSLSWVL